MLEKLDLTRSLTKKSYERQLPVLQAQLGELGYQLYLQKRSLVVVYEGWDAAGKGGNIRRMVEFLDPRGYEVFQIAAPSGDEKTHHYLWRFWKSLEPPAERQILIFDRSWYGRVLVERIEGFCTEPEWKRAYREINEFERQLSDAGALVVKLWLHISKEEQERRFQERAETSYKRWKLTEEDWRNRQKWDAYEVAAEEMFARTSTPYAPWTLVEANFKWFARLKCLRTVIARVSKELDYRPGRKKRS